MKIIPSSPRQDNILSGLPHASVFVLSDMEWDGLRPRIAGYIMYSSTTVIVFTLNDTVVEFTLDQDDVFRLTDDSVSIPADDTFFNVNYDESLLASLTGNGPLNVNSVNWNNIHIYRHCQCWFSIWFDFNAVNCVCRRWEGESPCPLQRGLPGAGGPQTPQQGRPLRPHWCRSGNFFFSILELKKPTKTKSIEQKYDSTFTSV